MSESVRVGVGGDRAEHEHFAAVEAGGGEVSTATAKPQGGVWPCFDGNYVHTQRPCEHKGGCSDTAYSCGHARDVVYLGSGGARKASESTLQVSTPEDRTTTMTTDPGACP